ncbi:MAG: T9SS type A sorting domain-containing protein [Bacteroidales bacterium]|nr:T9SS type A sorting domain-containing protein [Bacteroidales bacterium]
MRKIFTFLFSFLSAVAFGQVEFETTETFNSKDASINTYKITSPIIQDKNGGYGFYLKTPVEFTSFALGWVSSTEIYSAGSFEIVYKVHKPNKGWTDWKIDDGFTKPNETKSNYYKSNLMFGLDEWEHDSIEFYIHPPEGEIISEIYLILLNVRPTIITNTETKSTKSGAKACPEFPSPIITRSGWCNGVSNCLYPTYTVVYRNPTHTVIHHGASPSSYTDGAAVVRSYWNYHVNTLGWSDIGYNYLFDKYGNFFQGRHNPNLPNQDVHGAHAGYSNTYSIGLNFLGDSDSPGTAPTQPQLDKCAEFLAWWYDYRGFDPTSMASIIKQDNSGYVNVHRICGHRDVNPGGTTCPGNALHALLPSIRTATQQILDICDGSFDTQAPTTDIQTQRKWYNSDFEVNFNDQDNEGGSGVNYSFYQVMDFNGTEWRANGEHGFFNDNFQTAIHEEWTSYAGEWSISENHLKQTNQTSTNTNIYAYVNQVQGETYLYHWKQKISGSGNNRRAGMHFFCSDPEASGRQTSYMLYLRVDPTLGTGTGTAEIYRYNNNSFETSEGGFFHYESYNLQPNIWYDVKIILNTTTGIISLYIDNEFVTSITDPTPFESGNSISLRTGQSICEYDDIKMYKTRSASEIITTQLSPNAEIRYQSPNNTQEAARIRTQIIDNANNWSESKSKNIYTDFDNPETDIEVTGTWHTDNFSAYFSDNDQLSGVEKGFFNISDFDGTKWTANKNKGHFFDDFNNGLSTDWTNQVGNWTTNSEGILIHNDESVGNSNIYAYLNQELSNKYLYEFDLKVEGSNINKRAGFHFFCDNPELSNRGNGYFIWFRLQDTQSLEFYRVTDNVLSLDKTFTINFAAETWYNIKILYDRVTGEFFVYQDNKLIGEHKDTNPYFTGSYISFRSGNSIMSIDNFRTFRSRYSNQNTEIVCNATDGDLRYSNPNPDIAAAKISSMCMDSAKNLSAIITKNYNIDFSKPTSISNVNDGIAQDVDSSNDSQNLSGNWTESQDPNSGISAYFYAIGTSQGGTDYLTWTNNGLATNFTITNANLEIGQTYYISVKAKNGAGLYSDIATSDGVLIQSIICPDNQYLSINDATLELNLATPQSGQYYYNNNPITSFNPNEYGVGNYLITYIYTDENNFVDSCTFTIYVYNPNVVECTENFEICSNANEFALEGATPLGGTYSGDAVVDGVFYPENASLGINIITYSYESEQCSFEIVVKQAPEVFCPNDINLEENDSPLPLSGAEPEGGNYYLNGNQITYINPANYEIGDYTIVYTYIDETTQCSASCYFNLTISPFTGLHTDTNFDFDIYPNPNTGKFKILLPNQNEEYNLQILNIHSQIIEEKQINSNEDEMNFNLSSGIYFVKLSNSKVNLVKKIFVE